MVIKDGGTKMNHLDIEQLAELKEVLEDEFQVLINTYLADAQIRLALIEQGIAKQDYEQIRLAAHSLKGASANIGAVVLSNLCEQLEYDCKNKVGYNLTSTASMIRIEFETVANLLSVYL